MKAGLVTTRVVVIELNGVERKTSLYLWVGWSRVKKASGQARHHGRNYWL